METSGQVQAFQADWLSKTLAGMLLGLALAYVCIALFAWYGPGGIDAQDKVQFNMWMIAPLWFSIFSATYVFRTGKRAWLLLGIPTLALYGVFFLLRSMA
ncbi:hypothetical protein NI389_09780 [Pseudoalteromonas xiamenensis]|uniref:hypothetical protein n=1 Tax=Pseudoalteromonas xiamenensis TaxID=882626 RepID=UPI0027E571C1|nr:hypothetical protein [Pseudoalteromonas xiamenensis]WMN58550.1 hypothetical protein NI389_09780 [Pseudoalteromonas xiamenensis]